MPEHVVVKSAQALQWKVYIDEPGEKSIDVSYSYQNASTESLLVLRVAGANMEHALIPSGKTVGEPNRDWIIDSFVSHQIGKAAFAKPGFYEVELAVQPSGGAEVKFQWIWLK